MAESERPDLCATHARGLASRTGIALTRSSPRTALAALSLAALVSAPANATTIYEGLFNGAPSGGNIPMADGSIPGQLDASSLSDNGSSVTGTEPINATVVVSVANASSTGTTANALAKLTGAPSTAVVTATSDTSGAIGIVVLGAGTTGSALIAKEGKVSCIFDGATTAGDYVQISSTTGGDCHDAGASYPTSGQVLGRVLSTNGSGGTYQMALGAGTVGASGGGGSGAVNNCSTADALSYYASTGTAVSCLSGVGSAGQNLMSNGAGSAPSWQGATVVSIANAGTTGTTNNLLAKLTGAPSTAVVAATSDTSGVVGVVLSGGGTTGNALIAVSGQVSCTFDGATTAGDYVQISSTTGGDCHDAGASYPSSNQVLGRVLSTNGSGGTYAIEIAHDTIAASGGGGGGASCGSLGGSFTLDSNTGQCKWTQTVSNAAQIDFTGLNGSDYHMHCANLGSPTNPAAYLGLRFFEGASTIMTASSYNSIFWDAHQGVNTAFNANNAAALAYLSSDAGGKNGLDIWFHDFATSGGSWTMKSANFIMNLPSQAFSGQIDAMYGGAEWNPGADTNAITGIRLYWTGGNISGRCTLYPSAI